MAREGYKYFDTLLRGYSSIIKGALQKQSNVRFVNNYVISGPEFWSLNECLCNRFLDQFRT